MKYLLVCATALIAVLLLLTGCPEEEEPLLAHVYGYMRNESDSSGVDSITLRIQDIDPEQLDHIRERQTITATADSLAGHFEMDSVCYGTSKMQGIGYVTIIVDSTSNPGWPTQYWQPDIYGAIDTVILYLSH